MPSISLNEQQIQWLRNEMASTQAIVAEKEQLLNCLYDDLTGLRGRIAMIQTILDALDSKSFRKVTSASETCIPGEDRQRTPMEMVRDEFKGMTLGDIAAKVLDEHQSLMTPREMSAVIYDAKTEEEFDRARNSLSAELRAGVKGDAPRWRKVGRYAYAPLDFDDVDSEEVLNEKSA